MKSLCPHNDPFIIQGIPFSAKEIITRLDPMLTPGRRQRIRQTIANRTYTIVPVMEGLYDRGNVSAVLRSAEALGYQAIHIVESAKNFKKANRVTQGAEKWLDIRTWDATAPCVEHLRAHGYRILATHFDNPRPIHEIDFTQPTAIFFGNEKDGVSDELLSKADDRIVIPMLGFSRSFNISVAAALILYHVYQDRSRRQGYHGDLSEEQQLHLTASYYLRSVEHAEGILLQRHDPRQT